MLVKHKILFFILCTVPILLICCHTKPMADYEFYVPVEKSNLYVRMIGNTDGPLIINLHGGPGAFSGFDHELNRKHLEDQYFIAYLDQRGGGKSDICRDSTMLTMQQFVTDLDVVVDTLKKRYPGKPVNLLGGSWGGTLGLLYMIDHQDKINSFVCVSGKADGIYPVLALVRHEKQLAKRFSDSADSPKEKELYMQMLVKLEAIEKSDFKKLYQDIHLIKYIYPQSLGFNPYWANKQARKKAAALAKDSAYYARAHYTHAAFDSAIEKGEFVNRVFRNTPAYNNLNILSELSKISKPVLVMQGEADYVIGVEQGKMIYQALRNIPEADKELHIIGHAAHNLNFEAEAAYYRIVQAFLNKHNR